MLDIEKIKEEVHSAKVHIDNIKSLVAIDCPITFKNLERLETSLEYLCRDICSKDIKEKK